MHGGEEQWRKPDLSQNEELHQVELKLWMISLMPAECTEYLQKLFGMKYNHLDNNFQIILGTAYLIKVNGFITVHQVLEITRITTKQGANVALGRLINAGVIQKVRQGKHFIYQLK